MNGYIDRMNYLNDPRVNATAPTTEIEIYNEKTDDYDTIQLPTKWAICDTCSGEGKYVNPSIDAGGISSEAFLDDPDFYDDYMGGAFDVPCGACGGSGKVKEADLDCLSDEQREALEAQQEAEYYAAMESRAERMMGA